MICKNEFVKRQEPCSQGCCNLPCCRLRRREGRNKRGPLALWQRAVALCTPISTCRLPDRATALMLLVTWWYAARGHRLIDKLMDRSQIISHVVQMHYMLRSPCVVQLSSGAQK